MNVTLFVSVLRQRLTSKVRIALAFCVFFFPLLLLMAQPAIGTAPLGTGKAFAFILAAGIIGQESTSGVMQLLFARPLRRHEFVVSRWLAIAATAAVLSLVQITAAYWILASHRVAPEMDEIATLAAQQAVDALGTTSVILFFSAMISGIGDIVALFLTQIAGQLLGLVGQFRQSPVLVRTGEEIQRFAAATVQLGPIVRSHQAPWFEVVSYLSTVALCLAVAIVALNRREISYATD
jgi:ABC-type transport system involved in multi-copper enzyme maturation permease subunit